MAEKRLAIIGGGFMGGGVAQGLAMAGWRTPDLVVADSNLSKRQRLSEEFDIPTTADPVEAVQSARSVLLAVKPQGSPKLLEQLAPVVRPNQLFISVMAGIRTETIEKTLGKVAVIRSMPNTPAAVGAGVTALAKGQYANDSHLVESLNILSAVGKTIVVEESQMDAVTAVSGTGPAYVFYLAENMIKAAAECGLNNEQAYTLTYQTLMGAAQLLRRDQAGPTELRRRVTSPNGTTHAAISHLQENDWGDIFRGAVAAAKARAEALGQ